MASVLKYQPPPKKPQTKPQESNLWSFRQAYRLTIDFTQEQRLDQVELCVWGTWEGVADWGVMIQLNQWARETEKESERTRDHLLGAAFKSVDQKLLTTGF